MYKQGGLIIGTCDHWNIEGKNLGPRKSGLIMLYDLYCTSLMMSVLYNLCKILIWNIIVLIIDGFDFVCFFIQNPAKCKEIIQKLKYRQVNLLNIVFMPWYQCGVC